MKLQLPDIIFAARKRPLSYNPETKSFIYYNEVEKGNALIYPIEKLSEKDLMQLAIERQLTNDSNQIGVLNGHEYSSAQIVDEMKKQTKIGRQLFTADIDYLKFFLEQFPEAAFDK